MVTIDPARRLANSLGLARARQRAPAHRPGALRRPTASRCAGELWALMLDAKRTFDELIEHLAPDARTRDEVLAQPRSTSSSPAPSPAPRSSRRSPSSTTSTRAATSTCSCSTRRPRATRSTSSTRPARLTGFFQGRAIKVFLRPAGIGGRIFGARHRRRLRAPAARHRRRPAGGPLGLLPRARRDDRRLRRPARERVAALLSDPGHDVPDRHLARATTPSRSRSSSTASCARRGCRSAALVVNRLHAAPELDGDAARPGSTRSWATPSPAASRPRRASSPRWPSATRPTSRTCARRSATRRVVIVPERQDDVHDVEGLAHVRAHLWHAG